MSVTFESTFTDIANAIWQVSGSADSFIATDFANKILLLDTNNDDLFFPLIVNTQTNTLVEAMLLTDNSIVVSEYSKNNVAILKLPVYGDYLITASLNGKTRGPIKYSIDNNIFNFNMDSLLPSDYTDLEYIETDGTTNCIALIACPSVLTFPTDTSHLFKIECDISVNDPTVKGCLMGKNYWRSTSTGSYSYGGWIVQSDSKLGYNTILNQSGTPNTYYPSSFSNISIPSGRFTLVYNNSGNDSDDYISLNDEKIIPNSRVPYKVSTANIALLSNIRHNMSSNSYTYTDAIAGKIYEIKIYNLSDSTLVGHQIPCKRNSDQVTGLYNVVTETFQKSAGSVNFIAGPEI